MIVCLELPPLCKAERGQGVSQKTSHIVDLSPYTEVWLDQDPSRQYYCTTLPSPLVCKQSYWIKPILYNNQYSGKRNENPPCYLCPPNDYPNKYK